MKRLLILLALGSFAVLHAATAKPLKVFILAGQSNMEGHAKIETFDHIGDDPETAPLLKRMRGADGAPRVCDHVWISYLTGRGDANGEGFGKLVTSEEEVLWKRGASNAGYHYLGSAKTFGLMGEAFAETLLGMMNRVGEP